MAKYRLDNDLNTILSVQKFISKHLYKREKLEEDEIHQGNSIPFLNIEYDPEFIMQDACESNWQIYHNKPGQANTNSNIESFNNVIKKNTQIGLN